MWHNFRKYSDFTRTIFYRCNQEKTDGKVKIENKLYIFRSIEDQVFDENVYPLSCSYEESSDFSFDLSKNVDGSGFLGTWLNYSLSKVLKNNFCCGAGNALSLALSWQLEFFEKIQSQN